MGRHSAPAEPGQAGPGPSRAVLVAGLALLLAVVAVVVAAFLLRGDGDDTTAVPESPGSVTPTSTPPTGDDDPATSSPTATATTSPTATESASPSPTKKSPSATPPAAPTPTLAFRMIGTSYLTIRLPGGQTLVSKTFHRGDSGSFNNRALQVVVGNSAGVRFELNGKPRPRGGKGEVETFVVRRR